MMRRADLLKEPWRYVRQTALVYAVVAFASAVLAIVVGLLIS
jgi:hypothetical protein